MNSITELQSIAIDEEGFPLQCEERIRDPNLGRQILSNLCFAANGALQTSYEGRTFVVEAFDDPLVAKNFIYTERAGPGVAEIEAPFGLRFRFAVASLVLDPWDRFHGLTTEGIPLVFSRKAQESFFDSLEEYDDEFFKLDGVVYRAKPWLPDFGEVSRDQFWDSSYQNGRAGWETNQPSPILTEMWPRMKVVRSRILVIGCGSGEDAAFLAAQGHLVTGVDFSDEAIARAKKKFSEIQNLKFEKRDAFDLPQEWRGQFDIVFEHTFYCAIDPSRRSDVVDLWYSLLAPQGRLFGIFFAMYRVHAPPFGGSEWEIRERLKKKFSFLFWSRWKTSIQGRDGKELFVLAEKRS